jgi:thiol-disulfide isomerase/thioredoxin
MGIVKSLSLVCAAALVISACGKPSEPAKQQQGSAAGEERRASADYPAPVLAAIESSAFVDLDGNPVRLEQFRGKVVIMDFWETWCGPCVRSFPTLERLAKEYPNDFAVLAITPGFQDTKEDVVDFKSKNPYPFTFVMDTGLSQKLQIEGIPFKVFVDAEGRYLQTVMGAMPGDYDKMKALIEKHRRS